jgi:hypothetical protein
MRRQTTAVAALLVGAGLADPAFAARWLEVGIATNGVRAYVDADSVSAGEGWVRVSQRFVFPKAHPGRLGRADQEVVYVCTARLVRTLRSVEYGKEGRVRRSDDGTPIAPYRITAGTLPQYIFDLLC